jgi:hypothetical protein
MFEHKLPVWVGEFGPVYTGDPAADAMRYQMDPLHSLLAAEFPGWQPGPFGANWYAKRHIRTC